MSDIPPPPPPPEQPGQQPPNFGPGAQQPPAYGYGPQPNYGYAPAPAMPQTSNDAVVALVLALLAWAVCPVVLAIVALVMAGNAKKKIAASNGWVTGDGLVTAARVIAWINIAVFGLGAILFIIAMIIGVASSDVQYGNVTDFNNNALILLGR